MKQVEVKMLIETTNPEEIKKWEHHIEYAIDLDDWPEIESIHHVEVKEI